MDEAEEEMCRKLVEELENWRRKSVPTDGGI
jgi:hypothetical protein